MEDREQDTIELPIKEVRLDLAYPGAKDYAVFATVVPTPDQLRMIYQRCVL